MTKSKGIRAPRQEWTAAQLHTLRALYPDHSAESVAQAIGRSVASVYNKAFTLGLRKSPGFLSSQASGRIQSDKQHQAMVASRFKAGMTPWNKGVKGSSGTHPNTRATQFKKGEMSGAAQHNYVPIGSLRVSKDGYLERKMTDDPSIYPARRWVAVHRLVWQEAHGPIPKGRIVRFLPGKKTAKLQEITLDRLECITRGQNAVRNHPRNKHPELGRLVSLKGAITRQVNRINREAADAAKGA